MSKKHNPAQKEGEAKERKSSTVFVQNLPPDATTEELQNVFSEVGPIQQCFVVTEKGSSVCRGFGYVKFAMNQDAESATKQLNGSKFRGKALRVAIAKPRLDHSTSNRKGGFEQKSEVSSFFSGEKPKDNYHEKEFKKEHAGDQKPHERQEAASKKGHEQPKREKPKKEDKEKAEPKEQSVKDQPFVAEFKPKPARARQVIDAFRVIVRNLAWDVTSDDLTKFFSQYGKVIKVMVPPGKRPGSNPGFSFVNFSTEEDTAKAVAEANGKKIKGRVIAVDRTIERSLYRETVVKQQEGKSTESKEDRMDEESTGDSEGNEDEEEMGSDGDDVMDEDEGDMDEDEERDMDEDDDGEDFEDEEDDEEEFKPKNLESKDVAENRTLFISNLPYSASEDELKTLFGQYGTVKKAILVLDRNTEEPKGSAFVEFQTEQEAAHCLEQAYISQKFMTKKQRNQKRKAHKGVEILESDIALAGRKLIVKKAVSRAQAADIVELSKKKKTVDKRNLHLAEHGLIRPEDPEAANLSPQEMQRHIAAWKEKKLKLGSPNFSISPVRLSIRNIPKNITEAQLEKIFLKAGVVEHGEQKLKPTIKQVIIVMDSERRDEVGNKTSRGFGFVEFMNHAHAMAALENLANKRGVFPDSPKTSLLVEFACENALKLQQRKARQEKLKKQKPNEQEPTDENTEKEVKLGPDGKPKLGRGAKQRMKKRMEKEIKEGIRQPEPEPSSANKKNEVSQPLAFSNPKKKGPVIEKPKPKKELSRKEKAQNLKRKKESPFFFTENDGSESRPLKRQKQTHQHKSKERDFEAMVSGYKDLIGKPKKKWDEL